MTVLHRFTSHPPSGLIMDVRWASSCVPSFEDTHENLEAFCGGYVTSHAGAVTEDDLSPRTAPVVSSVTPGEPLKLRSWYEDL